MVGRLSCRPSNPSQKMAEVGEKVFYVYAHFRADAYPHKPDADPCDPSGGIFYIGKGTFRSPRKGEPRHRASVGRSAFWKRVVQKHGFVSVILFETNDEAEAFLWERRFIAFFGKRFDNSGSLVNITDGGEGTSGIKLSPETRANMSRARLGKKFTGKALEKKRGATIAALGRPVLDIQSRETWPSASAAARARGIDISTTVACLSGRQRNFTSLRYINRIFEVERDPLPRPGNTRPRTLEFRRRMSALHTEAHGCPVVNTETGQVWLSQAAAAASIGMNPVTFSGRLRDPRKKPFPFRRLSSEEKGLTDRTQ